MSLPEQRTYHQPEPGHYVNGLLLDHPDASLDALAQVGELRGPVDEQVVDNIELVRGFTDWAATEYLQGDDYWGSRNTLWRGIHWAYAVTNNCGRYIPSLRASSRLDIVDNGDHYQQIVDDSFGLGFKFPEIDTAAAMGQEYIDPDGHFLLLANLGALAGFTMIDNNESKKTLWRHGQELEIQAIRRTLAARKREADLRTVQAAREVLQMMGDGEIYEGITGKPFFE